MDDGYEIPGRRIVSVSRAVGRIRVAPGGWEVMVSFDVMAPEGHTETWNYSDDWNRLGGATFTLWTLELTADVALSDFERDLERRGLRLEVTPVVVWEAVDPESAAALCAADAR